MNFLADQPIARRQEMAGIFILSILARGSERECRWHEEKIDVAALSDANPPDLFLILMLLSHHSFYGENALGSAFLIRSDIMDHVNDQAKLMRNVLLEKEFGDTKLKTYRGFPLLEHSDRVSAFDAIRDWVRKITPPHDLLTPVAVSACAENMMVR
jgi:hypothetical protein